jgi:hypothetical protein
MTDNPHALAFALILAAVFVVLAWHWFVRPDHDWTGRRKSIKLKKRRNEWDDRED